MKWGSWELRFQQRTIGTGWSMKKICFGTSGNEKDMLWNGWQGREKGVLRAAHTYTANIRECPPPPPPPGWGVVLGIIVLVGDSWALFYPVGNCPQWGVVLVPHTVRAENFTVVLFSRNISRVKPSQKFPLQFMSIHSNDNISKIAKLTPRELPHLAKTAKITVRENNGVYSSC